EGQQDLFGAPSRGGGQTPASKAKPTPPPEGLNRVEQQLYDALAPEPMHLDTLCERAGVDVSNALVYLLGLELGGHVGQLAGRQFYRR
ncbi:MAG: hypothetical protein AAGI91_17860, partial [Bacteroidota bacterium]